VDTVLPTRPWLKPWYRVAETERGVAVEYAQRIVAFEGAGARRLLPELLPLLDGTRTERDLVARLGEARAPAVRHALEVLAGARLLEDGGERRDGGGMLSEEAARFVAAVGGGTVETARERLRGSSVAVAGTSRTALEVARLLRLCGAAVGQAALERPAARRVDASFAVVAPAPAEAPLVAGWNESALEGRAAWLLVAPFDGRFAAVGPVFVPGETCCFECLRLRRVAGLDYADEFWALERRSAPERSCAPVDAVCAGLAATATVRALAGGGRELAGAFLALELGAPVELTYHRVFRVPRCPACWPGAALAPPLPWFKEPFVGSS
jgi:bacteriocin biosynthesis cyclodehydratase domain-containing protein